MGRNTRVVVVCALVLVGSCGTGDTRIDPGDLELRDLLGVAPDTAARWDADQRASARRVFDDALASGGDAIAISLVDVDTVDAQVARTLAALDATRFADGAGALGLVHVGIESGKLMGSTRPAPLLRELAAGKSDAPAIRLELTDTWRALPTTSHDILAALARDGGATTADTVLVVPAPRLTVIAGYVASVPPRMLVNPVLLAAVDPGAVALTDAARTGSISPRADEDRKPGRPDTLAAGNPYSFYGSVAECAQVQRSRCAACVAAGSCFPVTDASTGIDECTALDADGGRGYYLLCANLAIAITSVESCTSALRPSCPHDTDAASHLSQLEANAAYIDDASCGSGLDACLAKIYGDPRTTFPGYGVDAGVDPVDPPRETTISCGDSCDNDKSSNCELSPSCSCDGPSCNNSLSCDSSCSSSNNQSGCGDNCDSCSSDSGGGGGGGCGGDSSGGSSGGGCGGSSGSSGGSCGGGDCGGGGNCGGNCGGGGGGNCGNCQVTKKAPSPVFAVMLSLSWALLPVPLAAVMRRRARKRRRKADEASQTDEEVRS